MSRPHLMSLFPILPPMCNFSDWKNDSKKTKKKAITTWRNDNKQQNDSKSCYTTMETKVISWNSNHKTTSQEKTTTKFEAIEAGGRQGLLGFKSKKFSGCEHGSSLPSTHKFFFLNVHIPNEKPKPKASRKPKSGRGEEKFKPCVLGRVHQLERETRERNNKICNSQMVLLADCSRWKGGEGAG